MPSARAISQRPSYCSSHMHVHSLSFAKPTLGFASVIKIYIRNSPDFRYIDEFGGFFILAEIIQDRGRWLKEALL